MALREIKYYYLDETFANTQRNHLENIGKKSCGSSSLISNLCPSINAVTQRPHQKKKKSNTLWSILLSKVRNVPQEARYKYLCKLINEIIINYHVKIL